MTARDYVGTWYTPSGTQRGSALDKITHALTHTHTHTNTSEKEALLHCEARAMTARVYTVTWVHF